MLTKGKELEKNPRDTGTLAIHQRCPSALSSFVYSGSADDIHVGETNVLTTRRP